MFQLSPALDAKYTLLPSQTTPVVLSPALGEIDLRQMTEYEIQEMEERGIVFPFLKPKKASAKPLIIE